MIYSVMNTGARKYDYYETPEAEPWHAPAPPPARASSLGAVPEDAAWPLPAGARKIGSGFEAKGRIAVLSRGGGIALGAVEPAYVAAGVVAFMALGGLALLGKGSR